MKKMPLAVIVLLASASCNSPQVVPNTAPTAANADPSRRQQAIEQITELVTEHCENGLHGPLAELASDQILIRGTAGETMEGRAAIQEMNSSYDSRNVEVIHICDQIHRRVYASAAGNIVWVEEGIRTHVTLPPSFNVEFPSQRTMIFEREGESWRLQYYGLSVALPDDSLDESFAQPGDTTPGEVEGAE